VPWGFPGINEELLELTPHMSASHKAISNYCVELAGLIGYTWDQLLHLCHKDRNDIHSKTLLEFDVKILNCKWIDFVYSESQLRDEAAYIRGILEKFRQRRALCVSKLSLKKYADSDKKENESMTEVSDGWKDVGIAAKTVPTKRGATGA
jgi:hypothetical protein